MGWSCWAERDRTIFANIYELYLGDRKFRCRIKNRILKCRKFGLESDIILSDIPFELSGKEPTKK